MGASLTDPDDQNSPLKQALRGFPGDRSLRMKQANGDPYWLTTSAHPVWLNDRIAGALVLEQASAGDLSAMQSALEWIALLTALAIASTLLALFGLASLTVARIERLHRAAEAAIDARGRVSGAMPRFRLRDEVASLASGYEKVLNRLREHQHYLANLRSRLVHELRTPIMVVRSSLDNLADTGGEAGNESPSADNPFVQRALSGAMRLERVLASMSEAASLESMLGDSAVERTDLVGLLEGLTEAYQQAYGAKPRAPGEPAPVFRFDTGLAQAIAMVVPETIAQAVDKLAANAVDFATPGSEIRLQLLVEPKVGHRAGYRISVINDGPALPAVMADSLFESMVSVRGEGAREQSHLGLGLYLVRLIAEFHGGTAFAENTRTGVRIGFTMASEPGPEII
ncbi:MAG: ATP-binding protein [Burkholderiaceae bacterium]